MTSLATQLRTAREARQWSGRELSRRSGVATTTISGIENGRITHPRAQDLGALESALDRLLAIETAPDAPTSAAPLALRHDAIHVRPGHNPRSTFDAAALELLADSIATSGLLQPLLVRPGPAGGYWLVAGERRWRAIGHLIAQRVWPADRPVPVTIAQDMDEAEHRILALVENLVREAVNPLDEGEAMEKLAALDPERWTNEVIAARLGLALRTVQQRRQMLVKLTPSVKNALHLEQINATQARTLMAAPAFVQDDLLARIVRAEPGFVTERDLMARIAERENQAVAKRGLTTPTPSPSRADRTAHAPESRAVPPARGPGGPGERSVAGSAHPAPPPAEPRSACGMLRHLKLHQVDWTPDGSRIERAIVADAQGTAIVLTPVAATAPGRPTLDDWIVKAATWAGSQDRYPAEILLRRPGEDETQPAGRYVFVTDEIISPASGA